MGQAKIIVASILGVAFLLGLAVWVNFQFFQNSVALGTHTPVELNSENLPAYMSQQSVIQDLPRNSKVLINFGDKGYRISNGGMSESSGEEDADVIVSLPEEYIERIGQVGACQALKEARNKNDISIQSSLSNTELAWKYRGMLKYRACFEIEE